MQHGPVDPDKFLSEHAEQIDLDEPVRVEAKILAREAEPEKAVGRPTIRIEAGELAATVIEAERALLEAGVPFYVRGDKLVRPVTEPVKSARGHETMVARLVPVTADYLMLQLAFVVRWEKWSGRSKAWVATDPPAKLLEVMLSRTGEWPFPRIAGVLTSPTVRPDGTLLDQKGYDDATRLLLVGLPRIPPIPTNPSLEEAMRALALLNKLLDGFLFADLPSRSVALSAILTAVARGGMSTAPLHVMRAPAPASGKSFLVDIASTLATGQLCAVMSAGTRKEETEKRLCAALLSAQAIISFDNVNGELDSDLLCQAVERPVVELRPLGVSQTVRIENRAAMFATGNNLTVVGDMVRRTLVCSLDTNTERPELRQFDTDPVATILADRGVYLAAVLTIIRAYAAAGFPDPAPPLASFDEWSRLVRSALVWLGCADPVDTMESSREEDPETSAVRQVFLAWRNVIGLGKACSAAQIIALAKAYAPAESMKTTLAAPELREALELALCDESNLTSRKLGKWLGNFRGRIVDGLKIEKSTDKHTKSALWRLVPCG